MFKKAKDIAPLHPGMADAMGAQLARQGFKTPEAPAVVEEPIVQVEPQEIEEATDGHKGRQTIRQQNPYLLQSKLLLNLLH